LAIKELCGLSSDKKWKLQYRATRDGFSAKDFHSECDGIANTLTVIKSEHDNIFGGFTELAWDSTSRSFIDEKIDPNAFIFSLVNKDNKPFKVMCDSTDSRAIICHPRYGPSFGGGDIHIGCGSNSNRDSFSGFGNTYQHADYEYKSEKASSILAGSYYFQTVEIEVFVAEN
jgi:hypothetical protein